MSTEELMHYCRFGRKVLHIQPEHYGFSTVGSIGQALVSGATGSLPGMLRPQDQFLFAEHQELFLRTIIIYSMIQSMAD